MYEIRFLCALGLTIGVETLILFLAARNPWKTITPPIPTLTILLCGVLSSGLTLPYVWFVWPAFIKDFTLYAVLSETFAIVAETGIFVSILRISPQTAFGLSVLCNACSVGVGKLLTML
jgi:hypothetical protein